MRWSGGGGDGNDGGVGGGGKVAACWLYSGQRSESGEFKSNPKRSFLSYFSPVSPSATVTFSPGRNFRPLLVLKIFSKQQF